MATPHKLLSKPLEQLEAREQPAANLLADLNTAGMPAFTTMLQGFGADLGSKSVFTAADGNGVGLFSSDGTTAGTVRIASVPVFETNPALMTFAARGLTAAGGRALYWTNEKLGGTQIWTTDGTATGTTTLKNAGDKTMQFNIDMKSAGGRVVFGRQTIPVAPSYTSQTVLYGSDGTDAGTQTLGKFDIVPTDFVSTGGKVFFLTTLLRPDANYQSEVTIHVSDGTAGGTKTFATLPLGTGITTWNAAEWATYENGKLTFTASNAAIGEEPWTSDGTAAGTKPLADLNPKTVTPWFGEPGSIPVGPTLGEGSNASQYTLLNGTTYFTANDGTNGTQLWSMVGTEAPMKRTSFSTEVAPGRYDPSPIRDLTAYLGKLYFQVREATASPQVYVFDPAVGTPVRLSNFTVESANGSLELLGGVGKSFYFQAGVSYLDRSVFVTDGSAAGAKLLTLDGKALKNAAVVARTGAVALFAADNGSGGQQLYATDGTTTKSVTKLNPNNLGSDPTDFTTVGTRAYFTAMDNTGNAGLFATDGTAAPTLVLKANDGLTKKPTWISDVQPASFAQLTPSGGKLYAIVAAGPIGGQLIRIDGTTVTTLKSIEPPTNAPGSLGRTITMGISNLVDAAGTLYFTLDMVGAGQQLWKTDGTAAGTTLVKTIAAKSYYESAMDRADVPVLPIRHIEAVGSKIYFTAGTQADGNQLWVSDGTAAGTKALKAFAKPDPTRGDLVLGTQPTDLTALNGKLYYLGNRGDIPLYSDPLGVPYGDTHNLRALFATDGTDAGTVRVAAIYVNSEPGSSPGFLDPLALYERPNVCMVAAGGKLFFPGNDGVNGRQLWVSDGTTAGTKPLTLLGDLTTWYGPQGVGRGRDAMIAGLTAAGDKVYFSAYDRISGRQLYVSDGTAAGTKLVRRLNTTTEGDDSPFTGPPVGGGAGPTVLAAVGASLVFVANDGINGRELWMTDGTEAGTKLVESVVPGPRGGWDFPRSNTGRLPAAVVNGWLVTAAATAALGSEPYAFVLPGVAVPPPVIPPVVVGVRPAVVRAFPVSAVEGTSFYVNLASVTLPNLPRGAAYSATITWGNGRTTVAQLNRATATGTTYTVKGGTTYANLGTAVVTIVIRNGTKDVLTATTAATVADAPWTAARTAPTAGRVGSPFRGSLATIADANPLGGKASDYTASIVWSNGRTTAGTVRRTAAGTFEVVGDAVFATAGKQTATVTVRAVGGKSTTVTTTFDIAPAPRR